MRLSTLLFTPLLLFIGGCNNQAQLPTTQKELFSPPGTVKVSENFYCDQTEISNLDWQEYVFWIKTNFGETSIEYLESLPDTTVWETQMNYGQEMPVNRFAHPAYKNYPVVGISKKQVDNYTRWRTERVIQLMLINNDFILDEKFSSSELNNLLNTNSSLKDRLIPVYRIPTLKEIETIDSTFKSLKNEFEENLGSPHGLKTCSAYCSAIHELNTNADEYLTVGTVGTVPSKYRVFAKNDTSINAWTSFRNVCSWVTVETYLKNSQ